MLHVTSCKEEAWGFIQNTFPNIQSAPFGVRLARIPLSSSRLPGHDAALRKMGDAQSAQRDGKSETGAEEQSAVEDAPSEEDELIKNNGQISDINRKPGVNGHCEDQIAEKAIILQNKDTSETEPKEINDAQFTEKELPDANEEEEIINMDAKQNDLNESFRRFFSNIGLKLTVKKGSSDKTEDETEKEEVDKLDAAEETASETKYEDIEQNTNVNQDNDSTTCPTMTVTPEDVSAIVEQKTKDASDNVDKTNATMDEDANQTKDATLDDSNTEEDIVSPIKKFFTTGIFSSLQKKKKKDEDAEEELVDMTKKDEANEQQETVENSPNVEAQVENQSKDVPEVVTQTIETTEATGKSPSTDQDSEPEITSSQEKVQGSPFKRLLSGSFRRRSKRQKNRRSSDGKLSDSGEHIAEHIEASTESAAEQQVIVAKTESPASPSPPPAEEPQEELSAWEAFKKLMTPKRTLKRPSVSSEEVQVPAAVEEPKPSEGEHVSDHSTEEGRKRKDSPHSWEAVLCGSGRRRSRKTSDSEDEQKQNGGEVDSPNDADVLTSTPKQAGSPSDSESSTWKSFKKLVTPKRKAKEEEEIKDIVQSDSETTQEESLFSIKKLFPGRKKAKSGDKPDQLSSDEAEKEEASMDEDSETPAVVPLSEFDKSETEAVLQTDVESQATENKLQDESEQEETLEIPQTFVQEVQEHQVTPIVTDLNQEQDELTEFSKYQPLSDIPEEGAITETMATSFTEEVAKDDLADDTIAEDMVELTSEAITAPEPVDITMADETEELMLSAVSQLSESSKTSGNTTPVPAEYDVQETEILLKQVVETISTSPKADTIFSEEHVIGRVVGSISHQILERSVTEEQNVLEIHAQSDAVTAETGLQIDKLDDVDEFAAESLSEFKDAISTEFVSEVSKEFESAKIEIDEVHTIQPEECVKVETTETGLQIDKLDDVDELAAESLSEFKDAISTEFVSEVSKDEFESAKIEIDEVHTIQPEECDKVETTDDEELIESISEAPELTDDEALFQDEVSPVESHQKEAVDELITEQSQILEDKEITTSGVELQKEEVDTTAETSTEDTIQEDKALKEPEEELAKIDQDQAQAAEIVYVQTAGGATELETVTEKLPDEAAPGELQEVTDTLKDAVEDKASAEDDAVVDRKQELLYTNENDQEHKLENQEVPEEVVQIAKDQESVPITDLVMQEQSLADIAKDGPEQESTDKVSEVSDEANKEVESTIEQESKELPDDAVKKVAALKVADATIKSVEETFEGEIKEEIVPSLEEEIKEVIHQDRVATDEPKEDVSDKLEEQQDTAKEECDENKIASQKIPEDQQNKSLSEDIPDAQTGHVSASTTNGNESEVISRLDQAVDGNHTGDMPLEGQIEQVDNSYEVADNIEKLSAIHISSVHEETGTAQVIEDTIELEKAPETCLVSTKELEHEVHIGEVEVNLEGQKEDEIPCTETENAEGKHAALLQETTCTPQNVTTTMPDLVIQKTIEDSEKISTETSIPCVDNAEQLDEPKHEVHLSDVEQVDLHGEKEEEIIPPETSSVEIQHAVMAVITTCDFKDVASGIPEVYLETTTEVNEAMFDTVASEQEDRETIETTTPLEVNNVTEMAQESDTVVLMHASSVQFEDNHRIQVQEVNVDIQSAETRVDTMLEVGVQETKEVVDICHETVEKVDTLSATSEIEQEIVSEEDMVAIQEVVQHEKEAAPEMAKSEHELEDEDQSSNLVDSKLSEVLQRTIETPDQELAVPILHESIAPLKNQVISMDEEIKELQTQQPTVQAAIPTNAAVAVPQNTGIISSFGNIESPSSLSLEFKLNIQFGQTKAPASSPSPTSPLPAAPPVTISDPVKSTEMSEVGVQAVEEVFLPTKQENAAEKSEIETKLAEAAVQATEPMLEPDSVDTVVIKNEPVLMDVGIQLSETEEQVKPIETALTSNQPILIDAGIKSADIAEPAELTTSTVQETQNKLVVDAGTKLAEKVEQVEQVKTEIKVTQNQSILMDAGIQLLEIVAPTEEVKSTNVVIGSIQVEEPVIPSEKREIILTPQVVLEVSEPIKQIEDEDENQDVWMDAEEDIDDGPEQTTMPLCEIEESFESQPDYFQETKAELTESYEDFAVPLEDPQIQTAIATVE